MPQLPWASTIAPVREPLGAVSSRALKGVTKSKSLPGAPDGEYDSRAVSDELRDKAAATETVVLSREASGWKVDGYFIKCHLMAGMGRKQNFRQCAEWVESGH